MKEFLDLKASQFLLLHAINEEFRTSKEVVDYFAINYPEYYSPEDDNQGLLTRKQLFPMIRYLGKKNYIKRDRSQRWMITQKGKEALLQNAVGTFRNVMQILTDPFINQFFPTNQTEVINQCKVNVCLSIEPLKFPIFPSTVTRKRLQFLQAGTFYLIDLALESSLHREEELKIMNDYLNSLAADLTTIIGECTNGIMCVNPKTNDLSLEIADESVDYVFSQFCFSSKNPKLILEEIYRVLKPGQFVNMMDFTADNSLFHIYQKNLFTSTNINLPPTFQKIVNPKVPFTKEDILTVIHQTPFVIVESSDIPNLPRFLLKKIN